MTSTRKSPDTIIELNGTSFTYLKDPIIKKISLSIDQGDFIGVIGPNGSGKSTLLKLMSGILNPDDGEVTFQGRNIKSIKRRELAQSLAWIPQENHLAFPFQAMEVVLMGRHPFLGSMSFEDDNDITIAKHAMEVTDIQQFSSRLFTDISGGEKKRVMLASAIAQKPEAMLLDEPTSALDIKYQIQILKILNKINEEQKATIILAMHDLHLASKFCKRLILLNEGQTVCDGRPDEVLTKNILEDVYDVQVKIFKDNDDGSLLICPG